MADPLPDGVHLGLAEAAYLADAALNQSGVKSLLVSPLTYWANNLDPDREDDATDAKKLGKAYHVRLVEGAAAFAERYAVLPDMADHPDALDGLAELKAKCKDLSLPVSGTVAELCERIAQANPEAVLWPGIMAEFKDAAEGKCLLKADAFKQLERRAAIIEADPVARQAFAGGVPEVSIFWTDAGTGIRMKCRVDYLKTRAFIDLKSFSNSLGMPVDVAVARAVANYGYHIQARWYWEGVQQAKRLVAEGRIFGGTADDLPPFTDTPEHECVFLFVETGRAPNVLPRMFRREQADGMPNAYWGDAEAKIARGVALYSNYMDRFGPDRPWVAETALKAFADEDFPAFMFADEEIQL